MNPQNNNQTEGQSTPNSPTQIPVMDVTPPKQYNPVENTVENNDSLPQSGVSVTPEPTAISEVTTPEVSSQPQPETTSTEIVSPALPENQAQEQTQNQPIPVPTKQKSSKKLLLVVVVTLILVALIGAAVFYFLSSNKENSDPAESSTTANSSTEEQQPADIAGAASEIESQSNTLNDNQDFPTDSLSDTALGL